MNCEVTNIVEYKYWGIWGELMYMKFTCMLNNISLVFYFFYISNDKKNVILQNVVMGWYL